MRPTVIFPLIFTALALAAAPAWAQTEDEKILEQEAARADAKDQAPIDDEMDDAELDEQVFYSGLGIARAQTDFSNLGDAVNLDAVLGFRIPTAPWFALEIDIGQTLIPGENQGSDPSQPSSNCSDLDAALGLCTQGGSEPATQDRDEFGMQALGISAVLKSTGRFYVTGKYGYRYIATSIDELNENRSSNGFGFGVGYRWGKGLSGVELGYKELSEDVDSVGLTFFIRPASR
jgi:hypothetical protein